MDESNTRVAEALREAMKAEIHGYGFYMMAARSTEDAKGREVFEQLAEEEREHHRFLRAHYESIISTGKPSSEASLKLQAMELTGESPIFSKALKDRIGDAHAEMSALSVGVQLEKSAQKFYREQADATDDPTLRALFEELAKWESRHYHALLVQQEALKEDYWSSSGFAPM